MTANTRITLNVLATYGRSLFAIACGIFSARWVLMALGQVDYGLYGLIGSMAVFVSFVNFQFASAVARYYAFAIGQDRESGSLDECQKWFSTAVIVHTVVPAILLSVGYPMGIYAITHGCLNIPLERVDACVWLWRFVCVSVGISMVNVPFQAMYTAKQYIAELTVYSIAQTAVKTVFIYYMTLRSCEWLVAYGAFMMLAAVVPQLLICIRAMTVFKECRFRREVLGECYRLKQLGLFAFWQSTGAAGFLANHQCMSIVINNDFGPRVAGSFAISQTVSNEASVLSGAIQGAFTPAITTACGAGDFELMRKMSYFVCKIGALMTLVIALPLIFEINEVLVIWLKDPPPMVAGMCVCALLFTILDKLSVGHLIAVNATGRVAKFQIIRGLLRLTVLPFALFAVWTGVDAVAVAFSMPVSMLLVVLGDVFMARTRAGMKVVDWLRGIVAPLALVVGGSSMGGLFVRMLFAESPLRVVLTTLVVDGLLLLASWCLLFSKSERDYVLIKVKRRRSVEL